jgi:hypothetical protein
VKQNETDAPKNNFFKPQVPNMFLTKKRKIPRWSIQAEESFNQLEQTMTCAPVLAWPNFSKPFIVECDAFGLDIEAVLLQDTQPIVFFSAKSSKEGSWAYLHMKKEMLALVSAIQRWRPYLLGSKFIVRTNQKSRKFLLDQTISTTAQQRWLVKLLGYDYEIEYKRGKENYVIDALSWMEEPRTLMAISHPIPQWLKPIQEEVRSDPELQALVVRRGDGSMEIQRGPYFL